MPRFKHMGTKVDFGEFLSPAFREQLEGIGHEDSRPPQAPKILTIRRSDVLSRSELNGMRGEVGRSIKEGAKPIYGAIKVVSWINENLRCLKRQGIRLIQSEPTGSYHLIDKIEREKTILRVKREDRVKSREKRNCMGNNQESSEGGFTSSRVKFVWNGSYIEVEEQQTEINELLDCGQNQSEIAIDMEDEKEDVISIYASDPEFDDLEGEEQGKNRVELEEDLSVGIMDSEFNSLMVGSRLSGRIGVSSYT